MPHRTSHVRLRRALRRALFGFAAVLCGANLAQARDAEYLGADALGMGQAWHALAEGASGPVYNPAGILQGRLYELGLDAEIGFVRDVKAFGLHIADGSTNPYLGGYLGYSYSNFRNQDNDSVQRHTPRFAVATPIVRELLYIGGGMKYVYMGAHGKKVASMVDLDLGLMLVTPFGLRVGAVGKNLAGGINIRYPRQFAAGVSYTAPFGLAVAYDTNLDFQSLRGKRIALTHSAGAGLHLRGFIVHAGYLYRPLGDDLYADRAMPFTNKNGVNIDAEPDHFVTATLGYFYDNFGFLLAYEQATVNTDLRRIGIDLRLDFDAGGDAGSARSQDPGQWAVLKR